MKRPLIYIVLSFLLIIIPFTQNQAQNRQRFDGGMMVHTGYLHGDLTALNYKAEGMTFGLGGVLRYHLGNHFRLGGEGYVSTLKQMHNGSYTHRHVCHATGRACNEKAGCNIELIIFVPLQSIIEGLQPCVKFGL